MLQVTWVEKRGEQADHAEFSSSETTVQGAVMVEICPRRKQITQLEKGKETRRLVTKGIRTAKHRK